jgi:hypothetical protein
MIQCDAENPLLCEEHGIPLDFPEVPELIMQRLVHLGELHDTYLQLQADLENAALLEGIVPAQVSHVAYHHPDGRIALRTLMHAAMEAELAFTDERELQFQQALEYVQVHLNLQLAEWPEDTRYILANLVCLRFLFVEKEYPGALAESHYEEIFGMDRVELFDPLYDGQVKANLSACDRAFLTFTTAVIPDEEDLVSLAYERILRRRQVPSEQDSERALNLVARLFSRLPEGVGD